MTNATQPEPIRVLVVEDDPMQRMGLEMLLESWGYKPFMVASPAEAEQSAKVEAPNIVLSDYRLGKITGLELIKSLRESAPGSLPAILLTGETSSELRIQVEAEGCHMIAKPCDPEDLRKAIDALIST